MSEPFAVPLISKNGIRGQVLTKSRLLDDSIEKSVVFETGRQVSVASDRLHLRPDGTYYLDLNVDPRPPDTAAEPTPPVLEPPSPPLDPSVSVDPGFADVFAPRIIPRIEEQAVISRRKVETGRIRIRKSVDEHPFTIDEPVIHEEYSVERVPVNRVVTETVGPHVDGDTTIVPVYEEETITIKRLVLREEIHLKKTRREERRPRTILLRKETVEVERIPTAHPSSDK